MYDTYRSNTRLSSRVDSPLPVALKVLGVVRCCRGVVRARGPANRLPLSATCSPRIAGVNSPCTYPWPSAECSPYKLYISNPKGLTFACTKRCSLMQVRVSHIVQGTSPMSIIGQRPLSYTQQVMMLHMALCLHQWQHVLCWST